MFAEARLVGALAVMALGIVPTEAIGAVACPDVEVKAAVRSSVERRMGEPVAVTLDHFACTLTSSAAGSLSAKPDSLARTGRSVRFVITSVGAGPRGSAVRLGEASAIVGVSGAHVLLKRAMQPGLTLDAADLEVSTGRIDGVPLHPMPTLSDLLGARLTRGLVAGQPISFDAVSLAPMVRSGDRVRLTFHLGRVDATAMAVARQTAGKGQIIRVVNESSRRAVRARVTAPGEVEVVQ